MNKPEKVEDIKPCPFCNKSNIHIEMGTRVWTGQRFSDPTHYELVHRCTDEPYSVLIRIKEKTVIKVLELWNKRV